MSKQQKQQPRPMEQSTKTQIIKTKILDQTFDDSDTPLKDCHVFILVNSRSGSCRGRQIIKSFDKIIEIKHKSNISTHFYIYDLYSQQQIDQCFKLVNQLTQKSLSVRILIGGGDGTIQWVLSNSISHKINFQHVIFCVLPIGTGNDFAMSIGWGNVKLQVSQKGLQLLARQLNSSHINTYDVWDCQVECCQLGNITEIKNGVEVQLNKTKINKIFTNYFGFGCDAHVTYLHQIMNAKTIFSKKVYYVLAGLKSFCTFSTTLKKTMQSFIQSINRQNSITQQNQSDYKGINTNISSTQFKSDLQIRPSDHCITFLNSTRSMQIQYIWQTPYSLNQQKVYQQQKFNDGIIQIVSYKNQFSLALQRCFHQAKRVGQGRGPFLITFQTSDVGNKEPLFIHINGEPYKIEQPKSIRISKCLQIPDSQIKVLSKK